MQSNTVIVEGLNLHYLEQGTGEDTLLLLHGWPTSSYLWRNIIPTLAENYRVIAPDLPGFGKSDKPINVRYSFDFYTKILDGFLSQLDIQKVTPVVHDLGGPVGLMWSVRNPEKLKRLVILNTLIYPELSWAAKLFLLATRIPIVKTYLTSDKGIRGAIRLGVQHKERLNREIFTAYQEPFITKDAQTALQISVHGLSQRGMREIADGLTQFQNIPVSIIYGVNDRILPDVATTMKRVKQTLPHAELHELPDCGHFLQEDEPEKLASLLQKFLGNTK